MDPRFSARVTKAWWLLSVILCESGESRNTNSKGVGRTPADLHPPLNKTKVVKAVVEARRRASEAKGPFPGGKRVGSWGKKKKRKERERKGRGASTSGFTSAGSYSIYGWG